MPGEPMWKTGVTPKMERARRSRQTKGDEIREKGLVRVRDGRCRFPRCGCQSPGADYLKAFLTVSHDFHKGMGGDPTGGVSIAPLMLALCKWRHQDAPVSRHAGTLRTVYLTPDHNEGPIAFEIDMHALDRSYPKGTWFRVGEEDEDPGVLKELTPEQESVLRKLAEMKR